MANFHPDLYVWLCKNYKEQPEKAQELMNFLGAASMVECQVYPVNSKYHMNLVGVPMTLQSRRQDYKLLCDHRDLPQELFWKVIRDNCQNGGDREADAKGIERAGDKGYFLSEGQEGRLKGIS